MNVFHAMVLVSSRYPTASRTILGAEGLIMVLISVCTSFGMYFPFNMYINFPMLIGLPLLAFGFGGDDIFALLQYFSAFSTDFIDSHSHSKTIGTVLTQAGPGTTLTFVCNVG